MAEEITVYRVSVSETKDYLRCEVMPTKARLTAKCLFVPGEYSIHEKCYERKLHEPDGDVGGGYFRTEKQAMEGFARFQETAAERLQEAVERCRRKRLWARGELAKEEASKRIEVGDVVRDSWGREGIVASESDTPDPGWLDQQADPEMRESPEGERWLSVYPLSGGAVLSPGSKTTRLRRPTPEDLKAAGRCPGGFTKDEVAKRFPQEKREER